LDKAEFNSREIKHSKPHSKKVVVDLVVEVMDLEVEVMFQAEVEGVQISPLVED
jgi:hypothetical protein